MNMIRSTILYRIQSIDDTNKLKNFIRKSNEEDVVVINAQSLTPKGMKIFDDGSFINHKTHRKYVKSFLGVTEVRYHRILHSESAGPFLMVKFSVGVYKEKKCIYFSNTEISVVANN